MNKKILIVISSACFFCLTIFQPAGSKPVTYRAKGELSVVSRPLEGNTGEPLGFSTIDGEKHSFPRGAAAGVGPAAFQRTVFALDYHVNRIGDTFPPVHILEDNRGAFDFVDFRFSTSRGDAFTKSKKSEIDPKGTNLPGKFIPFPVNESVMLLLIGSGLILLAGLGMKTYRKIISNL
jgi:hypothetical protein